MSRAQFGILSTFDHNTQTWNTYKGRLYQYFVANDIDEQTDSTGKKRKAILLSALSEGTFKLATDLALPKAVEDVPYEDLIKLLDRHFTPKRVGFGERHNFYAATQQAGESHSQWAARLRGLTARCGFLNVEEALRDKFIMGMQPGPEKEKLYAQDLTESTLAKVLELAENMSCARAAATASAVAGAASDSQFYKISDNGRSDSVDKVKCSVCGFTNHKSSQCKYKNYICKKCHEKGHLRKMCGKVNYVEVDGGDDGEDDGKICYIRSFRGEPMVETILIRSIPFKFEIDSGSAVTVISESYYKTNFKDVPLSVTRKRLMTYTASSIVCLGTIRLPVCYAGRVHDIMFYVVRDGGPPLLGRDFISKFKLQLTPVNYCSETDQCIENLQQRYSQLFSNELGRFNKYKVKLQLKDDAKPVFYKARPIAFALRDKVDKELDRLVNLGIVEPVEYSTYASPIVPVLKRDGSVRLCADYSISINKQLLVEQYPLPTTNDLFSKIHGGQQFSKLDLTMAYNQFMLDDGSKNLTCINTHRGLFRFNRLVFGLASAPAIFQRAIEGVLAGLEGVLCLLDDILVTGRDRTEHLERLNTVLARLQDAGLTLKKEKCSFFKDEVNYLGYIISKEGLKKEPGKVKAMLEAPIPRNVSQLQSFLGLVNYYRHFVPNASGILSPLYELLKKGCNWSWTEVHDKALKKIKMLLTSERVLAHFDPKAKIILTVDASPCGLGAILSQVGQDGVERPISYASRTLNSAEKRYAQIQKEATAIIYGVRRFHQYLYGRSEPFVLRTDHKPLLTIFGPHKGIPEMSANRLQRYALFLSSYNYTIEYIRSVDNSADYLSRASLPIVTTALRPQPQPQFHTTHAAHGDACACTEQCCCEIGCDRATYVCFVVDGTMPITLSQLREETKRDVNLQRVKNFILKGWPRKCDDLYVKPYHLCRSQLAYENGCVMRGHKVVIPKRLQQTILKELHSSHLGIVKTKAEARSRFWFPGIDQALEEMIGSCEVCIQLRPSPPRASPSNWEIPPYPFYRLHIDFLGPIRGCVYLVIVDAHTKWVEVYNMNSSTTSAAVIGKLCDFMSRFGVPQTIVSDNGTAFSSQEFKEFCVTNGCSHLTSPVYHPPSNGQAESFVKIVKRGIKSCLLSCQTVKEHTIKLLKYLMDYRNSVHTTTGCSPAEMVFGHKLRSRLDLIDPKSSSPSNEIRNQQCMPFNRPKRGIDFQQNTFVLFKRYIDRTKHKWCKGIIIKKIGRVLYLIRDIVTLEIHKRHINQLMLYKGNRDDFQDSVHNASSFIPGSPPPPSAPPTPPALPPPPQAPSLLQESPSPALTPVNTPTSSPHTEPFDPSQGPSRGRRAEIYEPNISGTPGESENESCTSHSPIEDRLDDKSQEAEQEQDTQGAEPLGARQRLTEASRNLFSKYF